jgi:2-aminoadipate transaminase
VVADWAVISRLLPLKTDGGSGAIEQMMLSGFIEQFDDHMQRLAPVLKSKADALVDALEAEFGTDAEFTQPIGGIYLWITLPEAVDTSRLAVAAAAEGVAINAGAEWSADPEYGKRRLRICFANPTIEIIQQGVAKLADVCHREFGIPQRGRNLERN